MALWSRLFSFTAGSAASRGASSVVSPVFGPSAQNSAARRPYAVLSPDAAADSEARDFDQAHEFTSLDGRGNQVASSSWPASAVDFEDDALRASVGPHRWGILRRLARQVPPYAEVLDLWRRGRVNEDTVNAVLAWNAIPGGLRPALKALRHVLPSVTDMVRFGVREVYNPPLRKELDLDAEFPEDFATDAARIGLERETAKNYWAAHWELPSFTQGAQMLFRGEINRAQFRDLLKALDFAPTWRGPLESIARQIPTLPDFIRFAVREVYSPDVRKRFGQDEDYPDVFTEKAALHGLGVEDAKAYWAAHWELPSVTQGFQMFHRDVIDRTTLRLLLRAKDVMPFWRDKLEAIAYLVPGRIDLRRMLAAGVIDEARVLRGYQDLGYNPKDAATLTRFAVELAEKSPEAKADPYVEKARTQLWNALHRSFSNFEADDGTAREGFGLLGVPAAAQDQVLTFWRGERDLVDKQLTAAQVKKAWTKALANPATGVPWTREDAITRLVQYGYSLADASNFLDLPAK